MMLSLWLSRVLTTTFRGLSMSGAAHAGIDVANIGPPVPIVVVVGRPRRALDRELERLLQRY